MRNSDDRRENMHRMNEEKHNKEKNRHAQQETSPKKQRGEQKGIVDHDGGQREGSESTNQQQNGDNRRMGTWRNLENTQFKK
jgi:hypothetical protein